MKTCYHAPMTTQTIRRMLFWLTALLLLAAFAPILSVFAADLIAGALGCELNEGTAHACVVLGIDIGELLYAMFVVGWLALLTVPLFGGIAAFSGMAWAFTVLIMYLRKE